MRWQRGKKCGAPSQNTMYLSLRLEIFFPILSHSKWCCTMFVEVTMSGFWRWNGFEWFNGLQQSSFWSGVLGICYSRKPNRWLSSRFLHDFSQKRCSLLKNPGEINPDGFVQPVFWHLNFSPSPLFFWKGSGRQKEHLCWPLFQATGSAKLLQCFQWALAASQRMHRQGEKKRHEKKCARVC